MTDLSAGLHAPPPADRRSGTDRSSEAARWIPTVPTPENRLGAFHPPRTGAGQVLAGGEPQQLLTEQTVLVVDLGGAGWMDMRETLTQAGYAQVIAEVDAEQAPDTARRFRPSLAMLDLTAGDDRGLGVLAALRGEPDFDATPLLALVDPGDADTRRRALAAGATDFLTVPADPSELLLRVRNCLVLKVYQDRLANNDPVTGLPNRRVFNDRLTASLKRVADQGGQLALLHVALDRFDPVSANLGPAAADHLASRIARRLGSCVRRDDDEVRAGRVEPVLLSRIDHDAFVILLPRIESPEVAARVARRILATLARPLRIGMDDVHVRPSVGIAVAPDDGTTPEALFVHAVAASAHAQHMGALTYRFHAPRFNEASIERLKLETRLRGARERGELLVHWQPQVDTRSGRIAGAEALIRWKAPGLGTVDPDRFLPMAEETGLIVGFGEWMIDEACSQWRRWRDGGLHGLRVSVNVSFLELAAGGLADAVSTSMRRHGLLRGDLAIEFGERVLTDPTPQLSAHLEALRDAGALLSVGEFGLGDTSMSEIRQVPLDELKIDRSFTAGLPHAHGDLAIVRAMVVLGHSLGLRLVAEGIEDPEQLKTAQDLEIDRVQGFMLGRPMPADELAELAGVFELRPKALGEGLGDALAGG